MQATATAASYRSRCGHLFGQLQAELEVLCAQNEALSTENSRLLATLQQHDAGAAQVVDRSAASLVATSTGSYCHAGMTPRASADVANMKAPRHVPRGSIDSAYTTSTFRGSMVPIDSSLPKRTSVREDKANQELLREFRCICQRGRDCISAEDLCDMLGIQRGRASMTMRGRIGGHLEIRKIFSGETRAESRATIAGRYREALRALNELLMNRSESEIDKEDSDSLQAQTYSLLFKDPDEIASLPLPEATLCTLHEICQVLISHTLARDIAAITDVEQSKIQENRSRSRAEQAISVLDFVAGVMIVLNMATITCSLDISEGWPGWERMEACFTCFFLLEVTIRFAVAGPKEFLCGIDMQWNLFDLMVVSAGVVDLCLHFDEGSQYNTPHVMLVRIVRILRIVKMVRMLRLRAFKELRLMVDGLFAGLRVISWAFVFLFFFILMLGITARQLLSTNPDLAPYQREMFQSVPRSMFTVYQCFIADACSTSEGKPLPTLLLQQLGPAIIIVYVLCYTFLTFGLFNLIMATIVESTMDAGKNDDVKRQRQRQREHLELALTVQRLVKALCTDQHVSGKQAESGVFDKHLWKRRKGVHMRSLISSRISSKQFLHMLDRPDIQYLFDRLGVKLVDPTHYIDSLDANEDGMLSIAELVRGLLKLRGSVEKADVVATLMVARDMQKSLHAVEAFLTSDLRKAVHQQQTAAPALRGGAANFTSMSSVVAGDAQPAIAQDLPSRDRDGDDGSESVLHF